MNLVNPKIPVRPATGNVSNKQPWSWLEYWTVSNVNNKLYKCSLCHTVNAANLLSSWGIVTSSAQEWKSKWSREDKKRYSKESLTEVFLALGITGCPISQTWLCFCYFLGFWSKYRETFDSHWMAHKISILKLALLSFLCEKLTELRNKT